MLAPRWYWKAVCDPIDKQSIFFWAENDVNEKYGFEKGCYGAVQEKERGVIKCKSLDKGRETFKNFKIYIPEFHKENCVTSKGGEAFIAYILKYLK